MYVLCMKGYRFFYLSDKFLTLGSGLETIKNDKGGQSETSNVTDKDIQHCDTQTGTCAVLEIGMPQCPEGCKCSSSFAGSEYNTIFPF